MALPYGRHTTALISPHRFAEDYLHLDLHLFQKIELIEMNRCTTTAFVASRGIGKSFISAVFASIRCVLYPGSKVCIASGTRGQAIVVLEKIMLELKPNSPELAGEIDDRQTKMNGTNAQIVFKNGSYIKVVTASESARGNRANLLILDEFRLIDKDTIDTILRKFLTQTRHPRYSSLSKSERDREYDKEKNMTVYLSSAYFADHWSYTKCQDVFKSMLDDRRKQFFCGHPYQLPLYEGIIDEDVILDDMADSNYSEIKFDMEYGALFYGSSDGSFFDFNSMSKNRKIQFPMLPAKLSNTVQNPSQLRITPKQGGEIRIMSVDIALMSSRKHDNDATSIFINRMTPSKTGRFVHNIVYGDTDEGLSTQQQALVIRKTFDEYECDYLAMDTNGIGLGVYDMLITDMVDPDSGEIYPAISCCNNEEMARRCLIADAPRVIWSIKASAQFNSDCAFLLREGFRSGRIRLLETEYDGEKRLSEIKGYGSLTPAEKAYLLLPYIQTTLLIDEIVKLEYEESGGKVKVHERHGMRKDRYSSLSYNYYVALQIENKVRKRDRFNSSDTSFYEIKAPKYNGKAVSMIGGNKKARSWK